MSTAVLSPPRHPGQLESTVIDPPPSDGAPSQQSWQLRGKALLETSIDFIPNPMFEDADAETHIPAEHQAVCAEASRDRKLPSDLPGHLARLCEAKLLSADEEVRLFRRMNFAKYRASRLCDTLDADRPQQDVIAAAERYLSEAEAIRDRIVQSNMRLVMSVVKKFVTPQHSFDDLLSDGIFSLIQAADKFDFDRGFRFSTYAYRAIARNTFRKITDRQKIGARFTVSSEDAAVEAIDQSTSSVYDQAWDRLRGLLAQMLDRLDRRERFIIRSRYALGSHRKVRSFQYLADKLGVSKERVRQLEQRAVAKLQKLASNEPIDDMVGATLG